MSGWRRHGPEYLSEGCGLGLFMLSASSFAVLLYHPASLVVFVLPNDFVRQMLMGLAMGGTAIALVYSPWGRRSGGHFNPALTWTFWRLGKTSTADAVCYTVAQLLGAVAGMGVAVWVLTSSVAAPGVNYVTTIPGPRGTGVAFLAELLMSAGLMGMVLVVSNSPRWTRWTGVCAGALIAVYITLFAPLSGMSLNPARTLASAVPSGIWTAWWVYWTAPLLGMLLAAEVYVRRRGSQSVTCAKLDHAPGYRCVFCEYQRDSVRNPSGLPGIQQAPRRFTSQP